MNCEWYYKAKYNLNIYGIKIKRENAIKIIRTFESKKSAFNVVFRFVEPKRLGIRDKEYLLKKEDIKKHFINLSKKEALMYEL